MKMILTDVHCIPSDVQRFLSVLSVWPVPVGVANGLLQKTITSPWTAYHVNIHCFESNSMSV